MRQEKKANPNPMYSSSQNNKRIAKNTLMLYIRMFLVMAVTLYTSRVVLERLGVEDFGIYNVVGGVVALLGFISSSMAISVQRFLTYEIGKQDYLQVSCIFSMAFQIHAIIALVVLFLLFSLGSYILQYKLVIPPDRLDAALVVFRFSTLSCGISILQVPFTALLIAYERMELYAYVSLVEVALKLLVAFLLGWIAYDSLSLYGALLFLSSAIIFLVYVLIFCSRFKGVHYKCFWDRRMFKSLLRFASWSALGEMAWGFTLQGVNVVLNLFFGTLVNAAYGISSQVSAAVYRFIGSFQTAVNPQLIKNYAQGNVPGMMSLAYKGIKFSFFLVLFIAYPLLMEMDTVLGIWLHSVPAHASLFCRLVVINALLDTLSALFATLAKAYGDIRNYQLVVSLALFLNFPFSYLVLKAGAPPFMVFVVYSLVSILLILIRCWLISNMFRVRVFPDYLRKVFSPAILVAFASALPLCFVGIFMETGIVRFLVLVVVSILSISSAVYGFGLSGQERMFINKQVIKAKARIWHG